jgi:hypothetical protein
MLKNYLPLDISGDVSASKQKCAMRTGERLDVLVRMQGAICFYPRIFIQLGDSGAEAVSSSWDCLMKGVTCEQY